MRPLRPGMPSKSTCSIRFVTRDLSDEEAAAVTAVLLATIDETTIAASVEPTRNAWVRSAGALRTPLAVGPGEWGLTGR